jgi:peroxiredoxin Q/BCP
VNELIEGAPAPNMNLPRDGGGNVSLAESGRQESGTVFLPQGRHQRLHNRSHRFHGSWRPVCGRPAPWSSASRGSGKEAHDKFIAKHDLGVILASDEDKSVLEAYGVWKEKSMYGRKYMGVERSTFLIDDNGEDRQVWRKVKVKGTRPGSARGRQIAVSICAERSRPGLK